MFAPITIRIFGNLSWRVFYDKFSSLPIAQNVFEITGTHVKLFSSKSMKVSILGAASKTGNCLSLFLKQSPLIDEVTVFDKKNTYGLALDLNYVDTKCKVSTFTRPGRCLEQTLEGAKIVMIVGDETVKDESNLSNALKCNANVLSDLLPNIIQFCPQAMVAVVMNPINSLIPLAMEMYKKAGVYEPNRLFGVISLHCVRANTFAAEVVGCEPECMMVPIIGGSCSNTCIPLFSQAKPCNKISQIEASRLTQALRTSNEELSKASKGKERTSFAMAFGAARFCISLCKALRHQSNVVEHAYVRSCVIPEVTYFAAPLELGPNGIQRHLGIPPLNDYECKLLQTAIPYIKKAITLGETLALGEENISSELCLQSTSLCDPVNSPGASSSK